MKTFTSEQLTEILAKHKAWRSIWNPILQTIIVASPAVPGATEKMEGVE